jgi:hypothetical protein
LTSQTPWFYAHPANRFVIAGRMRFRARIPAVWNDFSRIMVSLFNHWRFTFTGPQQDAEIDMRIRLARPEQLKIIRNRIQQSEFVTLLTRA